MDDQKNSWQPQTMPVNLMIEISRLSGRRVDEQLQKIGLRTSHLPIFFAFKNGGPLTQKKLAAIAEVEQSSMAQLLDRMEKLGLVKRFKNPSDRRSSLVSLTTKAELLYEPGRKILTQCHKEAVEGLSDSEINVLLPILNKIIHNLKIKNTRDKT